MARNASTNLRSTLDEGESESVTHAQSKTADKLPPHSTAHATEDGGSRFNQSRGPESASAGTQAALRRGRTVVVRRENGTSETAIARREEDEDGIGKPDWREGPRELTGPSAPLECGTGAKTRTAALPIGNEESRLQGAEHYYPPRFRRSVAESGTWLWPGQG
ncbi:hypothetical protein NDU88_001480 [Pleurodeles waltl]|uniref:Uncharacterized protein n=1 Tax=Pleurodeles waltl TaxID=8319 RepID=A0AAV7KYQ5_PLEWA|nr:hypothetical protein NDU88_001480 [Pleurodeles waltl]